MTDNTPDIDDSAVSGKKVIGTFIIFFAIVAVPLTWWFHGGGEGIHDSPPMESKEEAAETKGEPSPVDSDVVATPIEKTPPDKAALQQACDDGDQDSCEQLDAAGDR